MREGLNPFEYGREVTGEELADRRDELAAVTNALLERGKLFLIGPRRYGKTSILATAAERLSGQGMPIIRYDLEAFTSVDELATALITDATRKLTPNVERFGRTLAQFFSALRPEFSYDPTPGTWSARLTVQAPDDEQRAPRLAATLDGLERLATHQKKTVGVILDEFQHVIDLGGSAAESTIRASIQRHRRVGYVFAGSETKLLTDMVRDPARPFYRLGQVLFLAEIPRGEFADFIERRFRRTRFEVSVDAIDRLFELADDVPYNVQALAHSCWAVLAAEGGRKALSVEVVERALDQWVRREDPFYTALWGGLTLTQRTVVLSVIGEGGRELLSQNVLQRYGVSAAVMQRSLFLLQRKGILRREEREGRVVFPFEDPFFREWIRRVLRAGLGSSTSG